MKFLYSAKSILLVLLAVLAVTFIATDSKAATAENAKAFVEDLGDKAVAIVTDKKRSEDAKRTDLMQLLRVSIDFDWVGRFVLGRFWRTASDDQKKRYLDLYREFLLKSYTSRVKEYTSVSFSFCS